MNPAASMSPFGKDPIDLLVVVVCYRAAELTIDCLRSLKTEVDAVAGVKVAVCENGTSDEAVQILAQAIEREGWGDWVWLKPISPNRGFAGGNNVILREALQWDPPPKHFMLLNADTIVLPGAIAALLDAAKRHPEAGLISARQEWPDGTGQVCCYRSHSLLGEFLRGAQIGVVTRLLERYDLPHPPADEPLECAWTCFAAVLVRRALVEQIGVLDDGLFLYFDDPEYCYRATRAGWRVLHWPEARVIHLVGQSNPVEELAAMRRRRPRYYYASRSRYYASRWGRLGLIVANLLWTAGWSLSLPLALLFRRPIRTCKLEWWDIWTDAFMPARAPSCALVMEEDHDACVLSAAARAPASTTCAAGKRDED